MWKLLKLREALTRAFLDAVGGKSNAQDFLVGVLVEVPEPMGLEVKIGAFTRADEDEKLCRTYFSSDAKRLGSL